MVPPVVVEGGLPSLFGSGVWLLLIELYIGTRGRTCNATGAHHTNDKYSKVVQKSSKSLSLLKTNQTYFRTTKPQNSFQFLAGQPFG